MIRKDILALKEFLIPGLKYVFPVQPQSKVRCVATAISASLMSDKIVSDKETYVWPDAKGNLLGKSIALYTARFRWPCKMTPCFVVLLRV